MYFKYIISTLFLLPLAFYFNKIAKKLNLIDSHLKNHSNHKKPTPRGFGFFLILISLFSFIIFENIKLNSLLFKFSSMNILLAFLFFFEDSKKDIHFYIRLAIQAIFALFLVLFLRRDLNILLSPFIENKFIYLFITWFGLLWFLNLYNFMDGIDLITTLNTLFILFSVIILIKIQTSKDVFISKEIIELEKMMFYIIPSLIMFAFFNKPIAKIFLGDSGSVALGFFVAFVLVKAAMIIGINNSIILSMYYILDSSISLLIRIKNKENITKPSATMLFFQKAKHSGFSTYKILFIILALNLLLLTLTILNTLTNFQYTYFFLTFSTLPVLAVLYCFARGFKR